MLQVIAAIIYISVLCWVWGQMLLNTINLYMNHQNSTPVIDVEFSCLTGLSFIGIVLQVLCLFMPLGGWVIHLLFALPPLLFYFTNRHLPYLFINALRDRFSGLNIAGWAFFIMLVLTPPGAIALQRMPFLAYMKPMFLVIPIKACLEAV